MRWISFFRDARWLGVERVVGYSRVIALAYIPGLVWFYFSSLGKDGSDFLAFWSSARFVLSGHSSSAYNLAAESAFQVALGRKYFFPFLYPPPFLLILAPFGTMPFNIALPVWVIFTFAVYAAAGASLSPKGLWPIMSSPAAYINAIHGQNGFLTGGILIFAYNFLRRRPLISGALFGSMIIKPHLVILLPVALIAGRHWRVFIAASLSCLSLLSVSYLLFGDGVFYGFLDSARISGGLLGEPAGNGIRFIIDITPKTPSVFAIAKELGINHVISAVLQLFVIAALGILVAKCWSSAAEDSTKIALLSTCSVLAPPYILNYDLTITILPICWLAMRGSVLGFRPWERLLLVMSYWMPFIAQLISPYIGFNPTILTSFALLALVCSRWLDEVRPHLKVKKALNNGWSPSSTV